MPALPLFWFLRAMGMGLATLTMWWGQTTPVKPPADVHRRGAVHRMPRPGKQALQRNTARQDLPAAPGERAAGARLRSVSWPRLESREERHRQDRADRLHQELGHARRGAERPVPDLPRRRQSDALGRVQSRQEQLELRRLSQHDAAGLGQQPAGPEDHLGDLRAVPSRAARRLPQALAHAAARGQDLVRRLPQSRTARRPRRS